MDNQIIDHRSASNRKKVDNSRKYQKRKREAELNDLRKVLNSREGRNVFWRLLGEAQVFNSIWEPSAKIHYNAGKQDFGHFVMSEILNADPEKYLLMTKEAQENGENSHG